MKRLSTPTRWAALIKSKPERGSARASNEVNNNDTNNRICIAQVCRMTSEVLDGQLQYCVIQPELGLNV